jgi:hypothetical protein
VNRFANRYRAECFAWFSIGRFYLGKITMTLTTLMASAALSFMIHDSAMDTLIANAVQVQAGDVTYTTFFEANGSYTTDVGIAGTWHVDGDQLCIQRSTGEGGCQPLQTGLNVGDSWSGINAATGATVTYTIVTR